MQRSLDGGQTWPEQYNRVVWDASLSTEQIQARLYPADACRDEIDMAQPHAAFYFGMASLKAEPLPDRPPATDAQLERLVSFVLRSTDKCATWERVPFVIDPPDGLNHLHFHNHPMARLGDGTFLMAGSAANECDGETRDGQVPLFGTDDDGMTWHYVEHVAQDPTGLGRPTYPGLLLLPSGRLLCTLLSLEGQGNFIGIVHSDDGGLTWSRLRSIVRLGRSPWIARRQRGKFGSVTEGRMRGMYAGQSMMYRSP